MESIPLQNKIDRKEALTAWLTNLGRWPSFTLTALPGDASFRQYYRLHSDHHTYIVMDAPTPQENCAGFVAIAQALRGLHLQAPEIIAKDIERGFLLLTDFGDHTFLQTLNASNADSLYMAALQALSVLQSCRDVPGRVIPPFTRDFMWQEWAWHKEWFTEKLLGISLGEHEQALDECYALLVESAATQPQVFMHRDYHSANLMVLPHSQEVGLLDFQDAFIGPVTYDLASLLRDCYINWPTEDVTRWALAYLKMLNDLGVLQQVPQNTFLQWFDFMSMQRHLKALLTFARKQVRDGQAQYLQHIPRTLNYLKEISQRYPQMQAMKYYLHELVEPQLKQVKPSCAR